jgi:hypothetical protein
LAEVLLVPPDAPEQPTSSAADNAIGTTAHRARIWPGRADAKTRPACRVSGSDLIVTAS